jgi:hypothetical protein
MPDILISFDTTGSMYPALAETRRKSIELVNTLFDEVPDLRIGVITHGDYVDQDRMITSIPLMDDKNAIIRFIDTAPRTNGGDSPEAYEYVLNMARSYNWRVEADKVFILIGDATPHPVGYRTGVFDHKVHGEGINKLDWRVEAHALVTEGINIYPVQALNRYESTSFYKELAKISGTPKLDLHQFSDLPQLLTAVVYKQQSDDRLQQYAVQLQSDGLFSRSMRNIVDMLLGVESTSDDRLTTRFEGDTHDLKEVDPSRFQVLHVDHDVDIKGFVVSTGADFKIGRGFYQLSKSETVQERKEVVLVDKRTGDMWSGKAARDMIGLPYGERGKVRPKYGFDYDVFIQSTSANRKLMRNTKFLYEAK